MVFCLLKKSLYPVGLSLICLLLIGPTAVSNTLVVSKGGGELGSIQTAIKEARPGDTVFVKEGTYEENVVIDKEITLEGAGRNKVQIVGAKEGYPLILVPAAEVTVLLRKLTLRDPKGERCAVPEELLCPSALIVKGRARVEIEDVSISGNEIGVGAIDSAALSVSQSYFSDNGIGMMLAQTATATVSQSVMRNNELSGALLLDRARAKITGSTIVRNENGIGLAGGALLFEAPSEENMFASLPNEASLEITDNIIASNQVGVLSLSDKNVAGGKNELMNNELDFLGNIARPNSLRLIVEEGSKEEITFPSDEYETLQGAIAELAPGGTITIREDISVDVALIEEEVTIRSPEGERVRIETEGDYLPFLSLVGRAKLTLDGVEIAETGGIYVGSRAEISILNSTLSKNAQPLFLMGSSRGEIDNSLISGSKDSGLVLLSESELTVTDSLIRDNNEFGIGQWGDSKLELSKSELVGNRPNGIVLSERAKAVLTDNRIGDNTGYGLALRTDRCGFDQREEVEFKGQISGRDNFFEGNGEGDLCPARLRSIPLRRKDQ